MSRRSVKIHRGKPTSDVLSGLVPQLVEYGTMAGVSSVAGMGRGGGRSARPQSAAKQDSQWKTFCDSFEFRADARITVYESASPRRSESETWYGAVKDLQFFIGAGTRTVSLREPKPRKQPLPPFTELRLPPLDNAELAAAFARMLAARRRRLTRKGPLMAESTPRTPAAQMSRIFRKAGSLSCQRPVRASSGRVSGRRGVGVSSW